MTSTEILRLQLDSQLIKLIKALSALQGKSASDFVADISVQAIEKDGRLALPDSLKEAQS
jgi:uncharacterized protein (DUF1778 family)